MGESKDGGNHFQVQETGICNAEKAQNPCFSPGVRLYSFYPNQYSGETAAETEGDAMTLLKDLAYEALLKMIEDAQIAYGARYSLNALSAQLEMSRTPVRDAIQRLCDEGRMDMLPSRGFELHRISREELQGRCHFTSATEGYCAAALARCVRQGDPSKGPYLERLKDQQEKLERCLDESVPFAQYARYDRGFHDAILESLEDPYFSGLRRTYPGLYDHPEWLNAGPAARKAIYNCHARILFHILDGNHHGAYDAVLKHGEMMLRYLPAEEDGE